MKRSTRFSLLSSSLLTLLTSIGAAGGCGGSSGSNSGNQQPFRDSWRVVHEGPFDIADADGNPLITQLGIGRELGSNDNFYNRGDVIVEFNGEPDKIKIEFRRFAFTDSENSAKAIFEKVLLWAYSASGAPKQPSQMKVEDQCGGEDEDGNPLPWQDGCSILVYYDGITQPQRVGADIRVTLPPDYKESVSIQTSDNIVEDTYPNRGDVCVSGLNGSVDVQLENGKAFVSTVRDIVPAPTCPPEGIDDCDNFDDPANNADPDVAEPGSDAWSSKCLCVNQMYDFGGISVKSAEPFAANITADIPAALWTAFRAENTGKNEKGGKNCPSEVDGVTDVEFTQNDANEPWNLQGSANIPSSAATEGAGFRVELVSAGCEPVSSVESPKDWDKNNPDPDAELRGKTTLCSGCLEGKSCEDLIGG